MFFNKIIKQFSLYNNENHIINFIIDEKFFNNLLYNLYNQKLKML